MVKVIIDEHDVEIARYILDILSTQPNVFMSWGVDPETMRPCKCGMQFHVQGFKHTGLVRVVLNEGADVFEVSLISESGETVDTHEDVYLDNLISVIDDAVEQVEDYDKRVAEEYPLLADPDNPEKVRPMEIIIL